MLPEPFKPNQQLSARDLSEIVAELKRLSQFTAAGPLASSNGPNGTDIQYAGPDQGIWIQLTAAGSAGAYSWKRVVPAALGTWVDAVGNEQGTTTVDPAQEANQVETVNLTTNPIVRAWRDPVSRTLLFYAPPC